MPTWDELNKKAGGTTPVKQKAAGATTWASLNAAAKDYKYTPPKPKITTVTPTLSPPKKSFDETGLGIAKNTLLGVREDLGIYNKPIIDLGLSIARAPIKALAAGGIDIASGVLNVKPEYKPQTKLEKFIFGEEPIRGFTSDVTSTQEAIKSVLGKGGLSTGISLALSPVIVGGLKSIDVLPIAAPEKAGVKAIKDIAKSSSVKDIEAILKSVFKVEGDIAPLAKELTAITKPSEVKAILKEVAKKTETEKYLALLIKQQEEAKLAQQSAQPGPVKGFLKSVKAKLVDSAAPIEDTLRIAEKAGAEVPIEQHITNQIDRVLRSPTIAGQFIRDTGLENVIKNVDNISHFDQYLIARHATEVAGRGIEVGRNLYRDQQLVKELAPKYEEAAKVVTQHSQKLLDYLTESGIISAELNTKLKVMYPNYVPLNRIMDEVSTSSGRGGGIANLSSQNVVKGIKGSERVIEGPIESILTKTSDVFALGEKNKAAQMLANYEALPGNPFQIKRVGEDAYNTVAHKLPDGSFQYSKVLKPEVFQKKNIVTYFSNGKRVAFETTPEIAASARSMNVQHLNIVGRIAAIPTRIARIGITGINLPFTLSNIAKDSVTGLINSKYALKTSIANPSVFLKGILEAVGHGKLYEEMARNGALGTSFDLARNQIPQTIEKIRSGKSLVSKIKYTVKHPGELLRAVENIVSRSEEMNRIIQYAGSKQGALASGQTAKEAAITASRAARENTVNFARKGEWGQVLNSTFLYLNANIQGTRTFVRNLRERPIATATKIAAFGFAPMAAVTAWNLSDPKRKEAYLDIKDYEKQGNMVLIPPDPTKNEDGTWNVIKVPISQEIAPIVGMIRRSIEAAEGMSPIAVQDIASAFVGSVSPIKPDQTAVSQLTPQVIKPAIESFTNKNLFTGAPIVPQKLEGLSPKNQYQPYTSGTARKVGELTNTSPLKIEQFIKSTVGGLGSQALNIVDNALAGLDIIPKDQIHGTPVINAILSRFYSARGGEVDASSNDKLKKLLTAQADESFRLGQEAEILYKELSSMPNKNEANTRAAQLKISNPKLYEELKDVYDNERKGLNYNDRLIKQLQVKNGARARFIWTELSALKTPEEKTEYYQELKQKGLLSETVIAQLKQLQKQKD